MLVTFTNVSGTTQYVQTLCKSMENGEAVVTRRCWSDLDREQPLKKQVQHSLITLAFTKEDGDDANMGFGPNLPSYTDITRPLPAIAPVLSTIFNTSSNQPQWNDGTNWRDADGNIT